MDHKDLEVWKKSFELVCYIYKITKTFPEEERYGLTSQIRRSAVSIPSNIAEGCARTTNKETLRFIDIACGSVAELETQLLLSERLGYISDSCALEMIKEVSRIITGFKKYLKNNK